MKRILGFLGLLILFSCVNRESENNSNPIIARVGNKDLKLSEIKDFFPENASAEDSLLIRNNVVDKWVRQTILLQEAEKYLKFEIDINSLVNDYRESLLIHNYEEKLVAERLDTSVAKAQIEKVYELNKDSYLLTSEIVYPFYAIVPVKTPEINTFRKNWIKQNIPEMVDYCQKYQLVHSFDKENWITFAALKGIMPTENWTEDQLKSGKSLDKEVGGIQYFVKVKEHRDKNDIAPLAYIEDKVEQVILYNRKTNLLKSIRQKLYERDLKAKKIKIYDI